MLSNDTVSKAVGGARRPFNRKRPARRGRSAWPVVLCVGCALAFGLATTTGSPARHDAFADRRPLPRIDLTNSGCIELLFADRKLKLRGHSDQFCQRFSLHFPCHVSSLDLHGDFAGPEFETDLFIEHTQNY